MELVSVFPEHGVFPIVILPADGPLCDRLREVGVECYILNSQDRLWWCHPRKDARSYAPGLLRRLRANVAQARGLVRRFKDASIDVVYTNTAVCPLGAITALQLGVPHVWHMREFVDRDHRMMYANGKTLSLGFANAASDRVICNSKAVLRYYARHIDGDKLRMIHNGPLTDAWQDIKRPHPRPGTHLSACIVGTIFRGKGQEQAIRAVAKLRDMGRDVHLNIYGEGAESYVDWLKSLSTSLDCSDAVHFHGFVADPREAYSSNHMALCCSRYEAFGRVIVEAMAAGTLVVAPRSGAIPELIEYGETGLLYRSEDVDDLVSQIIGIWDRPKDWERIVKEAREKALSRFSLRTSAEKVAEVLREAVDSYEPNPERNRKVLTYLRLAARDHCLAAATRAELEATRAELEATRAELEATRAELEAIKRSITWRLRGKLANMPGARRAIAHFARRYNGHD